MKLAYTWERGQTLLLPASAFPGTLACIAGIPIRGKQKAVAGEGEGEGGEKGEGEGKGGTSAMQATGDLNYLHLAATSHRHRHLMDMSCIPNVCCVSLHSFSCAHIYKFCYWFINFANGLGIEWHDSHCSAKSCSCTCVHLWDKQNSLACHCLFGFILLTCILSPEKCHTCFWYLGIGQKFTPLKKYQGPIWTPIKSAPLPSSPSDEICIILYLL